MSFFSPTTTTASAFGTAAAKPSFSFGGGGDTPKAFGSTTESKPFSFTSPTTAASSSGFGFAANTAAPSTNLFGSPASQASPVSGIKPLGSGFASPPNQTISPAFGQAAQGTPQTLAFGATTQPKTGLFGTPSTTQQSPAPPPGFGFSSGGSFSFDKPQTTSTFGFATPASGFSSAPQAATAVPAPAPNTQPALAFGASNTNAAPSVFSTPKPAGFGSGNLSFGATSTAQPTTQATLPSFGQTTTPKPGFGSNQPLTFGSPVTQASNPVSTAQSTAPKPLSFGGNLSFGSPAATTQATFATSAAPTFGATTSAFGISATTSATSTPATAFGAATSTPSTGLSFGTGAATSTATSSFSLTPKSTAATTAPATILPTFKATTAATTFGTAAPTFGTAATTTVSTSSTGFQLGGQKPVTSLGLGLSTSQPSSTAPPTSTVPTLGAITTSSATMPTSIASTAAPSIPQPISSINFVQLEENINKWTIELEEQERTFINQATQINAWDRLLIMNGEKIVELNEALQNVKGEQQNLDHELDFVLAQQKELEDLLAPLEKQLQDDSVDRLRDPEREHMYSLAENMDTQLRQMSEDLKEVIEHLNETNRSQDSNDPIVQIGRILNAHMSSMQWIDNSIAQISTKLDHLKATHDTLRRDNERSFQLTYN